jgi:hypothetical protein
MVEESSCKGRPDNAIWRMRERDRGKGGGGEGEGEGEGEGGGGGGGGGGVEETWYCAFVNYRHTCLGRFGLPGVL